jgi:hypothetical protein
MTGNKVSDILIGALAPAKNEQRGGGESKENEIG